MKTLVIPDLHGKSVWKEAVKFVAFDKVVFLGDYTDCFYTSDFDIKKNLNDIIDYKKNNPETVELLLGNHDIQYMFYPKFRCSGFRSSYAQALKVIFIENKDLFKFAYSDGTALYTHGGFLFEWLMEALPTITKYLDFPKEDAYDPIKLSKLINNMEKSYDMTQELMAVSKNKGGSRRFGGPLWCDIEELIMYWNKECAKKFYQIVGHSRLDCSKKQDIFFYNGIYFTDILDQKQNYLVFDSDNSEESEIIEL